MGQPDDLIGSFEACRILKIDRSTLHRWHLTQKLTPATRLDGPSSPGPYLYRRADVERLAAERAKES